MRDERKTKKQLIAELAELRQCVAGLEAAEGKRRRAEQVLRQRNRELELLNRVTKAFSSSLDLDHVLVTVLKEVRRLLNVVAASVWLIDLESEELVCRQATGPQSEIVRNWRLPLGEGIASWVALSGESLIVPDTRADERHFKGVDLQTGMEMRSILNVPLRIGRDVIGVLQVVDTDVGLFDRADLELIESIAATAAVAIENAELYWELRSHAEQLEEQVREETA